MKKRKIIGFVMDDESIKNSVLIKLDEDAKGIFSPKGKKFHKDYLIEFLQSKEIYDNLLDDIHISIHNSLTKEQKENCPCSQGKTNIPINEKSCTKQTAQFHLDFSFASNEFIQIVKKNPIIHNNKAELKKLTFEFFNCFKIIPEYTYFDLDLLIRYTLDAGFKSLSEIFEGSETLNYLKSIDRTINLLGEEEIHNELFEKEDANFVALQIKFLERKRIYLKNKIERTKLEGEAIDFKKITKNASVRPNRTDLAYFIYYLEATNTKIIESEFPSDKAWKEIGDKFEKSWKNIQKTYNLIVREKERLKNRRDNNLLYVIENMLGEYPKALNLAKDDLKLAQLNS